MCIVHALFLLGRKEHTSQPIESNYILLTYKHYYILIKECRSPVFWTVLWHLGLSKRLWCPLICISCRECKTLSEGGDFWPGIDPGFGERGWKCMSLSYNQAVDTRVDSLACMAQKGGHMPPSPPPPPPPPPADQALLAAYHIVVLIS